MSATLFTQSSFLGGLNLEADSTKVAAEGGYTYLANGRVRSNSVVPVKKNTKIDIMSGKKQGIYGAGGLLIAFVDGMCYYWDVVNGSGFHLVAGWTQLNPSVDIIDAELIPYTGQRPTADDATTGGTVIFNKVIADTPQCLFITDGINQPRLLFPDGTW